MKIAQIQMNTHFEIRETVDELERYFRKCCKNGVDMVFAGEMFSCPYRTDLFRDYAEPEGGELYRICSRLAKEYQVYFAAGTMPEIDEEERIYNTAYVFGRKGELLAKYRKMHLFDINIPGKQTFRESDTLTPGTDVVVFDTEFGRMGICICFDLRFPELAREMYDRGAKLIVCPAAFNMTTGPLHWELLFRARAVDNQCFYVGTSSALNEYFSYHSYGHSIVVSPWGEIISQMSEKEGWSICEVDFSEVDDMRKKIPLRHVMEGDRTCI